MSLLSHIEKGTFLKLFNRDGYVLDYYKENYEKEYEYSAEDDIFGCSCFNAEYSKLYTKCKAYMASALDADSPLAINAKKMQENSIYGCFDEVM